MSQRSLPKRLWYDFLRIFFRVFGVVVFQVRVCGREHVPASGSVLVLSHHQSHLDPVLIGLACDRRMNFLARQSLFGFAPFRWLINSLDAIPLDREGLGIGGLKESLRRLKQNEMLLIFPEGTRTPDGEVGRLMPGFLALARRTKVPLLPVAMDGAYDSWPKRNLLPKPAMVYIHYGPAIFPDEAATFDDAALLAEIDRRVRACHAAAREHRRRALNADCVPLASPVRHQAKR